MANKRNAVIEAIIDFRDARAELNRLKEGVPVAQEELIPSMRDIDPDNHGIVFDPDDPKTGTAFVQQNSGTEYWDQESLISYLKKRPSLWRACSSRVMDINKWEAEIANGNVPAKVANKFKKTAPAAKPFIRFGKPTKESK